VLDTRVADLVVLAYPGPLSGDGVAVRSPTILGPDCCEAVNVKERIARMWPATRIHVVNDLTAAGFFFVAHGHRDFCVLTVGSGIGNKVFLAGHPYIGPHGYGGEIGHLKARPKPDTPVADIECELGEIASGRGTTWLARRWIERRRRDAADSVLREVGPTADDEVWSRVLAQGFRANDRFARNVVEAAAYPLAHVLSALHLGLGLEQFFVVGGFARALGPQYRELLSRLAGEASWHVGQSWNEMIEVSGEGEGEEALLGSCYLADLLARSTMAAA
jgi:glucokinase